MSRREDVVSALEALYDGDCLGLSFTRIDPKKAGHRSYDDIVAALSKLEGEKAPVCIIESYTDVIAVFAGNDRGMANAKRFVEGSDTTQNVLNYLALEKQDLLEAIEMANDVLEELQGSDTEMPKEEIEDMLSFLVRKLKGVL